MAASSLSVATAALPTSSQSFSSSPIDHFSLNFFPCKPTSIKTPSKLKAVSNCLIPFSFSRSAIYCASTAFDGVDLDQEELVEEEEEEELEVEEPSNGALGSASEAEEENDAPQFADGGRLYVGNLPFSMTSSQLSEIFAEAGRVVSAEVYFSILLPFFFLISELKLNSLLI